ncbi:hypothetical protein CRE_15557 [Caenorhabditis remanei]|uniref:Uncharacterized protein n=1 Tax=Caenorhabditis remanei TaxID=31234 RepID=E3MSY2_CAERE|nr:hypothetical protein CRE_15557 [Caenorhabditis remanei]
MNTRTVEAFVLSNSRQCDAYFAFSKEVSRDLIISYCYVPPGVNLLGKWLRVLIRDNSAVQKVVIINDIFESRVMNGIPEIKVQAEYDGRFEDRLEVFKHDYFGFIFDKSCLISNVGRDAMYSFWITRYHERGYSFRWRISHSDNNFEGTVEAIVHSYSPYDDGYYAWTKSEPRTKICVDNTTCPPDQNMIGKWITASIDRNNRIINSVTVIDDVYETRMRYGSTEILIEFEMSTEPGMFFNHYFGNISDPRNMVTHVERGAWYRGWIIFYIKKGVDTRWRLSKDQTIEGPFFNKLVSNQRRNSYGDYEQNNTRNHRSFSPDVLNHYNNDYNDRNPTHSSSDPNTKRGQQWDISPGRNHFDDGALSRFTSNKNPIPSDGNNFHESCPLSGRLPNFEKENSEDYPHTHFENRSPHLDERRNRNNLERHKNEDSKPDSFKHESKFVRSDRKKISEKIISPESEITESRLNDTVVSDLEYYTCSDEETKEDNRHNQKSNCRVSHHNDSESSSIHRRLNENQDALNVETKIVVKKPSNSFHSNESKPAANHTKSENEKEVRRLKLEILRMSQLVKSLTMESFVSRQMRLSNPEDYEELMELIET